MKKRQLRYDCAPTVIALNMPTVIPHCSTLPCVLTHVLCMLRVEHVCEAALVMSQDRPGYHVCNTLSKQLLFISMFLVAG
jgi:hypothetical protein